MRKIRIGQTFFKIKNSNIHYLRKGNGDRTIIFASGMGSNSFIWNGIQDSLAKQAVTLSYDRAGLFLSDSNDGVITNQSVSNELTEILEKTNCPKPYILVVHSMAGIYLRPFIARHHNDLSGIMFMEAAHPMQIKKSSEEFVAAQKPPPFWIVKFLLNTGIYRLVFNYVQLNPEIPISHPIHQMEKKFFYRSVETLYKEINADKLNFDDSRRYGDFGDIPLKVVSGTSKIRTYALKKESLKQEYLHLVDILHHDFLRLSKNSRYVEASRSGHVVQVSQPQLIIDELKDMLINTL